MRIVVPDAASASALAERLTVAFGAERISLSGDRPEVGIRVEPVGPDNLQVTVAKEEVQAAPNIDMHGDELSEAGESALYHHYQLNYTTPETKSGRRLARR